MLKGQGRLLAIAAWVKRTSRRAEGRAGENADRSDKALHPPQAHRGFHHPPYVVTGNEQAWREHRVRDLTCLDGSRTMLRLNQEFYGGTNE